VRVGDGTTVVPDRSWPELCQSSLVSLCLTFSPEWREARGGVTSPLGTGYVGGGEFLGSEKTCCDFS